MATAVVEVELLEPRTAANRDRRTARRAAQSLAREATEGNLEHALEHIHALEAEVAGLLAVHEKGNIAERLTVTGPAYLAKHRAPSTISYEGQDQLSLDHTRSRASNTQHWAP